MTQVITLSEWDRKTIRPGDPTASDLDLAARLDDGPSRRLELRWHRDGRLEMRSTSWVGVVRLHGAAIQVRPKYAGNELGVLRMLAYCGGYESLKSLPGRRTLPDDGAHLLDLICHLLADEAELVLRDGLLHDYSDQEDALTTLRGSLRYRDQATRRFGQLDVLECRFDEFNADVIENELLRTGLAAAGRICSHRPTRQRVRRLEASMTERCSVGPIDANHYRQRLTYGRRNERYRRGHELALLLLETAGVDDLYGSGRTDSFAFLIDMNVVFERFVSAVMAEAFSDTEWMVCSQQRTRSVVRDRITGKRYTTIIPDLVLRRGSERVPVDCKYKLYGGNDRKISSADIYQTFLYAFALAGGLTRPARAGIIYPATRTMSSPHLEIRQLDGPASAQLTGIGVDLLGLVQALDNDVLWHDVLGSIRTAMRDILHVEPS